MSLGDSKVRSVPIDDIRIDGGTQPRAEIDMDVVEEYAGALHSGVEFPPVDVFHDGTSYWLADGFHRYHGAVKAELFNLPARVHKGTVEAARWFSLAANQSHGLRRTNEDKRRAVTAALKHPNGAKLSDNKIAEHCGVDHKTVASVRESLLASREIPKIEAREVTRNGKTYTQDTTNIGRKPEATVETAAPVVEPLEAAGVPFDPDACATAVEDATPERDEPEVDESPAQVEVVGPRQTSHRDARQSAAKMMGHVMDACEAIDKHLDKPSMQVSIFEVKQEFKGLYACLKTLRTIIAFEE